jgi:RsiW-degrading membrane proteinase PrsW (M82 family)
MPVYTLTMLTAALLVLWVYHQDSNEREPWYGVVVALVSGFGAMWLLGLADQYALDRLAAIRSSVLVRAATIAIIEEGGKLLTVLLLAHVFLRREFNDPMDGLIYGRLAGLGMAVNESLMYLSFAPPTLNTFGMEIVRLFAHSLMGGIVGFAIGLGAKPGGQREIYPRLVVLCVALSTTMHFAWNSIAYTRATDGWSRLVPMIVMLTLMVVWRWFCQIAQRRSRLLFDAAQMQATPFSAA